MDVVFGKMHELWVSFLAALPNLALATVTFGIFLGIAKLIRNGTAKYAHRATASRNVGIVIGRLVAGVFIFIGLGMSLSIVIPSLKASDLFNLLGISGVAIGFAFKDIFQNMLAGIILLVTRPFDIGDQIRVGDMEGNVEEIQVRATILKSYDHRKIVIPNADLYTQKVVVNTGYKQRRVAMSMTVPKEMSVEELRKTAFARLREIDDVMKSPEPNLFLREANAETMTLELQFWVSPPVVREVLQSLGKVVAALHKEIPEATLSPKAPGT